MGFIPDSNSGKIEFNESRLPKWQLNAVAIGSSAAEITDLQTKTTAARSALQAQQAAQDAAKSATILLNNAVEAMSLATSKLVAEVRLKAKTAGTGVYALADIPEPALPSPRPAPGEPNTFSASLDKSGALTLKWKCSNPRGSTGTVYQVWRSDTGVDGTFVYLGGSGTKDFVDTTVPRGINNVTYKVQAVRSTAVGPWGEFTVKFSTLSNGVTQTTVTSSPKIAA